MIVFTRSVWKKTPEIKIPGKCSRCVCIYFYSEVNFATCSMTIRNSKTVKYSSLENVLKDPNELVTWSIAMKIIAELHAKLMLM